MSDCRSGTRVRAVLFTVITLIVERCINRHRRGVRLRIVKIASRSLRGVLPACPGAQLDRESSNAIAALRRGKSGTRFRFVAHGNDIWEKRPGLEDIEHGLRFVARNIHPYLAQRLNGERI